MRDGQPDGTGVMTRSTRKASFEAPRSNILVPVWSIPSTHGRSFDLSSVLCSVILDNIIVSICLTLSRNPGILDTYWKRAASLFPGPCPSIY